MELRLALEGHIKEPDWGTAVQIFQLEGTVSFIVQSIGKS